MRGGLGRRQRVRHSRAIRRAWYKRLINASNPDFRLLVEAALFAGARYGELAVITVKDFDPDAGTVYVSGKTGSRHIPNRRGCLVL